MSKVKVKNDLTGKRFVNLTVINQAEDHIRPDGRRESAWLCICDCGNTVVVKGDYLKSNSKNSCGKLNCKYSHHATISVGDTFGHLTVIDDSPNWLHRKNGKKDRAVLCECDCKNKTQKLIKVDDLRYGRVSSCGCLFEHHHMSNTKIYQQWAGMCARCNRKTHGSYKNYGARGISVCKEWEESFETFYSWAIENGFKDGLTIERIDNNGDYCPENCIFIHKSEQSKNRRNCIFLTYNNQTKGLKEWSKITGIKYGTLLKRYHQDEDPQHVLKEFVEDDIINRAS